MIKFRTQPRGPEWAQDDYWFNSPAIIKVTPKELLDLEIRMSLGEKHSSGKQRFIPHDNILFQAAQILETDENHEGAICYGCPIAPYMAYMESVGVKERPQLNPDSIPEELRSQTFEDKRYDKWVLAARKKDTDDKWAVLSMASDRSLFEDNLHKAKDSLNDPEEQLEFLIIERLPNVQE